MNEEANTPSNTEIDKALKEFEAKSGIGQIPKSPEASEVSEIPNNNEVSEVKFETDSYKAIKYYNETATPRIVKLVMKYSGGTIKEQKTAEYVLLGFVVLAIGVSLYLFFGGGSAPQKPSAEFLKQLEQMPINK
jgi:hypothetical protein